MVRMAAGNCTVQSFLPWQGKASVCRGLRAFSEKKGGGNCEVFGRVLCQGVWADRRGGAEACWRPYLVSEALQALLGTTHHQDLVYPDKPHGLGAQLDAVLGALGVSVK
jgi:hypothetical protein